MLKSAPLVSYESVRLSHGSFALVYALFRLNDPDAVSRLLTEA